MSSRPSPSPDRRPAKASGASSRLGALVFTLGALSFAYGFLQRVAPSSMVSDLMQSFGTTAAVLGNLSAIYFYVYACLQMPLGVLVDRLGPRVMMAGFLLLGGIGSLIFGLAATIEQAYFGRLLVGIGASCSFIATLALAAGWFPPERFAFLSGTVMLIGLIGGFVGQGPFATLVVWLGWRQAMLCAAAFAVCLAAVIWIVVRDAPPGQSKPRSSGPSLRPLADLGRIVRSREAWALGFIASACSGPMLAFGGLWGVPYMIERYDLSRPDAAFYTSMMLVGWAAGAPLGGWLSDALGRRKPPLVFSTVAGLTSVSVLFYGPDLALEFTVALLAMTGFVGGWMASVYAYARETAPPRVAGSMTGFVNMMTIASGAVLQPVVGLLLDSQWDGRMENGVRIYSRAMYETAFSSIAVYCALGLIATLFVGETHCRQRAGTSQSS